MIDTSELGAYMGRKHMSAAALARRLDVSEATVRNWLKKRKMDTVYAAMIIDILEIPDAMIKPIFFTHDVA